MAATDRGKQGATADGGKIALLCPGQGAQRPGGVVDLDVAARRTFERASAVVGFDLWEVGLRYGQQELARPSVLQPLLVTWAVAEVERARAERPELARIDFCLGHSSGENAAAVLSGALTFEEGVRFAHRRGRYLDRACEAIASGLLALSGAERVRAEAIAVRSGTTLANHNGVDQCVLGGSVEEIERARRLAEWDGLRAVVLRVAGAFHTTLFEEADALAASLIDALPLREPFTPLIGNAGGQGIDSAILLREELQHQYSRPVEWLAALRTAYRRGVRTYAVTGPGNAMAGLLRRFGKSVPEPLTIVRLGRPRPR